MIKNHHLYPITSILFCMLVFFLPISKAFTSIISTGLIVYALYYSFSLKTFPINWKLAALFFGYVGLSIFSLFYSHQFDNGLSKVLLKAPIAFTPFIIISLSNQTLHWKIGFEQLFIWMAISIGLLSTLNYYGNKEALDFMVLQNKPIPVMSHIYHIEFSIILSLAILICAYRILFFYWSGQLFQFLYLAAALIGTYCIHVMSVRTGLLCLYVGFFSLLIYYIVQTKKYWILIAGFIFTLGVFGLGYKFSESFKNRIELTLDDLNVLQTDRDRNWHSVSMRVDAFNNGISVFKENWQVGVGIGDVDTAVQSMFIRNNSKLQRVNRKKPHHQFLENGIQSGFLSPFMLLALLLFPILFKQYRNPLLVTFVVVMIVAMQFESILERQSTIVIFILLYSHSVNLGSKKLT